MGSEKNSSEGDTLGKWYDINKAFSIMSQKDLDLTPNLALHGYEPLDKLFLFYEPQFLHPYLL